MTHSKTSNLARVGLKKRIANYKKEGSTIIKLGKKIFIITVCLLISIIPFTKTYAQQVDQDYLKITYDDKVIFHNLIDKGKIIQVKNNDGEIVKSEVFKHEMTLNLNAPEIPKGYLLSYWDIQQDDKYFTLTPVFIKAKAFSITFNALEGGSLINNNNALTKVITKSVDQDTPLSDVLPDIQPQNNHKFAGWFTKNKDEYKETDFEKVKISSNIEYYAIFYPDLNDNNIDDRTEQITIKFNFNFDNKTDVKKIYVGQNISLPKIERKDYILIGWFYDKDFDKKYNPSDPLIEDTTLFAKWEKAEKVIKESAEKPITDKEISNQIEKLLQERQQPTEQNNENTNKNTNKDTQKNNIETPNLTTNEIESAVTYTEEKYVFKNDNIDKQFLVKFVDDNGRFLFSIVLPYGRLIHLLDQNGNIKKEYAVRQDTLIPLKIDDYINSDSVFLGFDSELNQVNNTYITEIYPETDVKTIVSDLKNTSYSAEKNDQKLTAAITLTALLIIAILVIIYFVLKRRKKSDVTK